MVIDTIPVKITDQIQVEGHANERSMRSSRGRDEDSLSAAVPHAILRVRKESDIGREIGGSPFFRPRFGIADGDKLDSRLLESENSRTKRS